MRMGRHAPTGGRGAAGCARACRCTHPRLGGHVIGGHRDVLVRTAFPRVRKLVPSEYELHRKLVVTNRQAVDVDRQESKPDRSKRRDVLQVSVGGHEGLFT